MIGDCHVRTRSLVEAYLRKPASEDAAGIVRVNEEESGQHASACGGHKEDGSCSTVGGQSLRS